MVLSLSKKLKSLKDYKVKIDGKIKDEVIIEYAPLVKFIAQRIASRLPNSIELDDLISCGVIGLMDAIDKFDPTKDNKLKTYAECRIRGAILDELRAQDWVPRSIRDKAKLIERTFLRLESSLGRPPTDDEMCDDLKCSVETYYELLNETKSAYVLNIDDIALFNKKEHRAMFQKDSVGRQVSPLNIVEKKDVASKIREGIRMLPEKQRIVLSLYYFEELNLKEIGQILDVTESRVSQLHTQAVMKLKVKLRGSLDLKEEDLAG